VRLGLVTRACYDAGLGRALVSGDCAAAIRAWRLAEQQRF